MLFFGTYDEDAHPRVRVLREGFVANGWRVDACNVPLRLPTGDRVKAVKQPALISVVAARVVLAWVRLLWRSRVCRGGVVLVGYAGHLDVHLARLRYPRSTIVLDHMVGVTETLVDRELGGPTLRRLAACIDRAALRSADVILVDTPEQRDLLTSRRDRAVVVLVGAADEWFRSSPRDASRPPSAVFFGTFSPLHGAVTIADALAQLDQSCELRVTMIGTGQDRSAAEERSRGRSEITWIDWVSPRELPGVVADHDICLGIFGESAKAQRVVPTKIYQGMAAGCAVITSDTTAQRAVLGDDAQYVPPGDPGSLSALLRALTTDRLSLRDWQVKSMRRADQFRPRNVVAPLIAALVSGESPR